jgi:chromosome segregation ATPase
MTVRWMKRSDVRKALPVPAKHAMMLGMRASFGPCVLVAVLAIDSTSCVRAGTYEKVTNQLAEAQRAAAQRDAAIRGLDWQVAEFAQQLAEARQRHDTWQREVDAQIQQLTATNAALAARLKTTEREHAALLLTVSDESRPAVGSNARAGDLPRRLSIAEARDAAILDKLSRIEQLLAAPSPFLKMQVTSDQTSAPRRSVVSDTIDPWGGWRQ